MSRNVLVAGATLGLCLALGGCSLFGIATKGDLEKQAKASEERQRQLDQTTKQLRAELSSVSEALESVGEQVDQSTADLAEARERAESERQSLAALIAQLERRLADTGSAIDQLDATMRTDVDGLRGELGSVRTETAVAEERSLTALRAVYERLLRERQRLSQELESIERELVSWRELGLLDDGSSSLLP